MMVKMRFCVTHYILAKRVQMYNLYLNVSGLIKTGTLALHQLL